MVGFVKSAVMIDTDKGTFCKISSKVLPNIEVTTFLPAERWTQRYFQGRGGENPPDGFTQAASCQPGLNGEFAYGLSNVRFDMVVGAHRGVSPDFVPDSQNILDYSYRGNHVAAMVSKKLIRAFYGKLPRYSYFIGCSDGGRQGLIEAQRFPEDFDGIGAGSPGILSTAEESTFHLWKVQADHRADGTNILMPQKVALLHEAVVAQCDTLSGVKDGLLEDSSACHFDPATLRCNAGLTDSSHCLTGEEIAAVQRLYDGAHDEYGHFFYFGLPRGSEDLWNLPEAPSAEEPSAKTHATQLAYILSPEPTPALADYHNVVITQAAFARASQRSPMFDAANTDLKPFAAHGGKLILWHGLNDPLIPARATLAYFQGVQKFLGEDVTDKFLRAFFLPGVGHCGGGDGYTELDVLSALMAWAEENQAPAAIVAGKRKERLDSVNPGTVQHPHADKPYAAPLPALLATRPLFPYPYIARYKGAGDVNSASSYTSVRTTAEPWPAFSYEALKLIGPDNQRQYEVRDGNIVQTNKP